MAIFRKAWIYVLHFDDPLHHARHYTGCTLQLRDRLSAHAQGRGSRLCEVLLARGLHWTLGGLMTCSIQQMRRIERGIKDRHNGPQFCQTCMGEKVKAFGGCTQFDVGLVQFPTDSRTLYLHGRCAADVEVRDATAADVGTNVDRGILSLMQADRWSLGFVPACADDGVTLALRTGRVVLALWNGVTVGYVLWTTDGERAVNVHQCVVLDSQRGNDIGRRMLNHLTAAHPTKVLRCKVRTDVPALGFWFRVGFRETGRTRHPTSGSTLVCLQREAGVYSTRPANGEQLLV